MKKISKTRSAKPVQSSAARKSAGILMDAEKYLLPTYKRQPVIFTHGRGPYVFDSSGKKYLDFLGGIAVNGLGHAHPRIVKAIRREAARAIHLSNLFHNEFQGPLAKKLVEISGMDRVFFSNSGTEAVEGALKLARLFTRPQGASYSAANPQHRILALENSFHGRTLGALSVTATEKYRLPFSPLIPGVEFVRFNDVADLESKFNGGVCAIIMETIQGEGGIYPVSAEFWNRSRELASKHGALVIADEIQCGLGRTGRYFGYQKFSAKPDIVVSAKPLAAGLPLGAILTSEAVAAKVSPGMHGTTFGGGPLICAVALEFLNILHDEKILKNAADRGAELRKGLEKLAAKFDFIKQVRGEGLMIGVELTVEGGPYVAEAMNRGLLMNCTHEYTLRLLPAFLINAKQVKEFLQLFEEVLASTPRPTASKQGAHSSAPHLVAHSSAR